jgi:Carboxypeptidase regulatory-like domain
VVIQGRTGIAVIASKKGFWQEFFVRDLRNALLGPGMLVCLGLTLLLVNPVLAHSQSPPAAQAEKGGTPNAPGTDSTTGGPLLDQQMLGSISGTVVDRTGAVVAGARVRFARQDQSQNREAPSGDNGQFSFSNLAAGPFQLTVMSAGFETQTFTGTLHPGETFIVPAFALVVATAITEVRVGLSQIEVAEEQVRDEEKQRVMGFIPNFYVTYVPNAAPLSARQKFKLAWKTTIDPVSFGLVAAIAGVQQAQNDFSGYGQGAEGYGKRFGASYANFVSGTFIGSAILPALLKQDPRYFYKGVGGTKARILYAMANAFICKSDKGHWQPNYSSVLGNLAAGGISNLYYPAQDREGAELTFESAAIGIGATAAANIIEEFLIRKLTPNIPKSDPAKP